MWPIDVATQRHQCIEQRGRVDHSPFQFVDEAVIPRRWNDAQLSSMRDTLLDTSSSFA